MATAKKTATKSATKTAAKKSAAKKTTNKGGGMKAATRNSLSTGTFAFPAKRKEPLNNASHVRNAIARFDQTKGVTDAERDEAFKNIKAAAKKFGVDVPEKSWHDLGKKPHTQNPSS